MQDCLQVCKADAAIDDQAFDLVLLDHQMDEMNGVELAGRIRRRCETGTVPAMVIISGYVASIDPTAITQARNEGSANVVQTRGSFVSAHQPSRLVHPARAVTSGAGSRSRGASSR